MVEEISGWPGPQLVHRSQRAGNKPPLHRPAEADRLVPKVGQGVGSPLAAIPVHVIWYLCWEECRKQLSGNRWVGNRRESGSPSLLVGVWGTPVSAFGSLQRGGHWVQAGALRLRRILYFGLAHETECTRCPVHRPPWHPLTPSSYSVLMIPSTDET